VAEDSSEHLAVEHAYRVFADRFDESHAAGHGRGLASDPSLGAFKHGGRGVNDRDGVARSRKWDALVASSTTYIDDGQGWWAQPGSEMLVDHVGANTATQRRVVAVHELVSEALPRVVSPSISHSVR